MSLSTHRFKRMVPALGTFVRLELECSEKDFLEISNRVFARIHELEAKLSFFQDESEISKLNRAEPGVWILLSEETLTLLKRATELAKDSNYAFSAGNSLIFDDHQTCKTNEEEINLGGIAKGYCVDQAWREAVRAAQALGIKTLYGSVNAGGDFFAHERAPTPVLIRGKGQIEKSYFIQSGALATSSVLPDDSKSAQYPRKKTALKNTVSVEASEAWLADALTKVALFHPHPESCLAKWNARIVYED